MFLRSNWPHAEGRRCRCSNPFCCFVRRRWAREHGLSKEQWIASDIGAQRLLVHCPLEFQNWS